MTGFTKMVQSDFTLGSVILAEKTTNDEDIVIKLHNNKVHFYVTGSQITYIGLDVNRSQLTTTTTSEMFRFCNCRLGSLELVKGKGQNSEDSA